MKKIKEFIKNNKKFLISIGILLLGQSIVYFCIKFFQKDPITLYYYLDDRIPFLGYFVYIYNSFYPFVFISLYFLYKKDKESYYKGVISGVMGYLICDVIFIMMPTIMYRPVIPNITPFTNFVINITYFFDNPPLNCFPSIHCLFCFQVIYSYLFSKYSKRIKIEVTICSLLIILSTLFVKQHYLYDVISAFLVCVMTNVITDLFGIYERFKKKKLI